MTEITHARCLVACLCAEWCGSCREYRAVFEEVAACTPEARFVWIDIEDHADVMGDIEVENFPSLLVATEDRVAFFGPVTPHATTLAGLVDRALRGELGHVADEAVASIAAHAKALAL